MSNLTDKSEFLLLSLLFSRSKRDLLAKIDDHLTQSDSVLTIFTPNSEQLVQAAHQPKFARTLQQADVLLPDGMGVVWASRILKSHPEISPISQRIAGVELVEHLLRLAQKKGLKVLLVGGRGYEGSTSMFSDDLSQGEKRVDSLKQICLPTSTPDSASVLNPAPKLSTKDVQASSGSKDGGDTCCLYWTPGYNSVQNPEKAEEEALVSTISRQLQPDIVLVAFGAPWQEWWVESHLGLLQSSGVKLVMTVGGAFDFLTGKVRRAPGWMQRLGLEWLWRLIHQPWRWRRQLRLIEFTLRVLINKMGLILSGM